MAANQEKPHGFGIKGFEHFANGEKVAQTFGHLFVVNIDETVVHPKARKGFTRGTFTLGNFIFMVRKLQIGTARVNVKSVTQHLASHGRALNVPTRPAWAKGAVPFHFGGLRFFGTFPQHKVKRIVFAIEHRHTFTRMQFIKRFARQLAIARKLANRVIHIALRGAISQTFFFQGANHA